MKQKRLPFARQHDAARAAMEQQQTGSAFEHAYSTADRRLADSEGFGRGRHVSMPCKRDKYLQAPCVEKIGSQAALERHATPGLLRCAPTRNFFQLKKNASATHQNCVARCGHQHPRALAIKERFPEHQFKLLHRARHGRLRPVKRRRGCGDAPGIGDKTERTQLRHIERLIGVHKGILFHSRVTQCA